MRSVGLRELRQEASRVLRRVAAGESVEITVHGRPVAVISPLQVRAPLERLKDAGEVDEAQGDISELPAPLARKAGAPAPSATLARLRRAER